MSESTARQIELHGHPVTYHRVGNGPALLLVHGITSSSRTWRAIMPALAEHYTVIAPDLLGHGRSAKPRGDYSLGAYASGLRDLLVALEIPRATVVGHSLGGGVAMQFAYQFPERVERLVLVDSGGLGAEVSLMLRAATLPGAEYVLPLMVSSPVRGVSALAGSVLGRLGLHASADVRGVAEGFESFRDADARRAFLHTARSVIDPAGQRVDASDRLYLAAHVPSLIVWGDRDRMIPVQHGHDAHAHMPNSRLEVFPGAGHFPFNDDPARFVALLHDFISTTEPATFDDDLVRQLMLRHRSSPSSTRTRTG
jgi:pimeloyl-ACP methyl ester carboxylesterase